MNRTLLKSHASIKNRAIIMEKGVDKSQVKVEIRFRILNQLKSCKCMVVNVSKLELFTENILPTNSDEINSHSEKLKEINCTIQRRIAFEHAQMGHHQK